MSHSNLTSVLASSDSNSKIDFLIRLTLARGQELDPWFFPSLFGRMLFFVFVLAFLYSALRARRASFVALNAFSERHLHSYSKSYEYLKYGVIIASLVAITTGLFANRLYDAVKPWLGV